MIRWLLPDDADPCLKIQAVEDGGGAHLDLSVEDVPGFTRRAIDLGATVAVEHSSWVVMRSAGGQLFCVLPWHGEAALAR